MENCKRSSLQFRSKRAVLAALLCLAFSAGSAQNALGATADGPTPEEQTELAKYPVYAGNIEVIAANGENGLHRFLAENAGKTVFMDAAILRYEPAPEGVTEATREKIPPTDRFENPVVKNCWGEELNREGKLDSGETGWPLPLDQADIEAGCATRIRIEMIGGDHALNLHRYSGFDKLEIVFAGFFTVEKEELEGSKTLYRLNEVILPEVTANAFFTHAAKKDRVMRDLGYEDKKAKPEKDAKGG